MLEWERIDHGWDEWIDYLDVERGYAEAIPAGQYSFQGLLGMLDSDLYYSSNEVASLAAEIAKIEDCRVRFTYRETASGAHEPCLILEGEGADHVIEQINEVLGVPLDAHDHVLTKKAMQSAAIRHFSRPDALGVALVQKVAEALASTGRWAGDNGMSGGEIRLKTG